VEPLAFSPSGEAPVADAWWTAFEDPALDGHIREALRENLSLRAAWARLEAAEAVLWRERAPLVPVVSGFADSSVGTDDPFGGVQRVPIEFGARASYEVDLWGRLRAGARAEVANREQVRARAGTAALSVSAEVARTWVALGATREQLALLDEQIVANQGMAEVVEARFLNGVVRQADALRQERLLEQTRAERIARLEDQEVLEHRLAVLLGRPPQEPVTPLPEALPAVPPLPEAGVPVELLRRRPDVRAAEQALLEADARVAVAVAEQFPRLDLRAGVSNAPSSVSAILEGWVASVGASLVGPLLGAGARHAEVRRAKAVRDEQLAAYGDALLQALREVEDALTRNRRQAEQVENLARQVRLAERTARGLQAQYTGGLDVGYLDVLTAQTTAQSLRRQQIAARRRHLEVRIGLYRALAGGLERPETGQEGP
jgi:outer membrane protein, multidrug efflux system